MKKINESNLILIFGFITIVPFATNSFFIHPSADDYSFYNLYNEIGYFGAQLKWYVSWLGRYSSTAILSLPIFMNESLAIYRLTPIFLMLFTIMGLYKLSATYLNELSKKNTLVISIMIFSIYTFLMPSPYQGWFWISSSITYSLSNILCLYTFDQLLIQNKKSTSKILLLFAYLIILSGLNETVLIFNIFYFFVLTIDAYLFKKRKKIIYLFSLLTIIICFLIVFFSPGNEVRQSYNPGNQDLYYSIVKSLITSKGYLGIWLPPLLLVNLILTTSFFSELKNVKLEVHGQKIFLFWIVTFSIPFLGFFISYWAIGNIPPSRAINIILFHFILLFSISYLHTYHYFKSLTNYSGKLSSLTKLTILMIFIIQLQKSNNIREAYVDLISGKSYQFNKEVNRRHQLISNSKSDTVIVGELQFRPKTIFGQDITQDSDNWRNKALSKFYKKRAIILKSNGLN